MKASELSNEQLIDSSIGGHILGHPAFHATSSLRKELQTRLERGDKTNDFFESISCLFAEGAEFMTKTEIYEAIEKEVKRIESHR
ncbi:MAG: hypothetical protein WC436_05995 [Candidatus Babeliales bacterium]|jgi:hypothetical protein